MADNGVADLLTEHQRDMAKYSPAESNHAIDASELHKQNITFWSARDNDVVIACGALKELTESSGEIKSMKTRASYLKIGLASRILDEILAEAGNREYRHLYIETGSHKAFEPATALYKKYGFIECEAFGDYVPDPYSLFYSLVLQK